MGCDGGARRDGAREDEEGKRRKGSGAIRFPQVSFPPIPLLTFRAASLRMRARRRGGLRGMGLGSAAVPEPLSGRCPWLQPGIVREAGSAQRRPTSAGPSSNRNFPVTAPHSVPRQTRSQHRYPRSSTHLLLQGKTKRRGEPGETSVLHGRRG